MLQELAVPSASASASPPDDLKDAVNRARRVLSDRRGNLAIIFLQQDRFEDAFELIEKLLLEDREYLYIRGLVVKQGTLGHYYLKQGEVGSAERVFYDALQFIKRRDENMFNSEWNSEVREKYIIYLLKMLSKDCFARIGSGGCRADRALQHVCIAQGEEGGQHGDALSQGPLQHQDHAYRDRHNDNHRAQRSVCQREQER